VSQRILQPGEIEALDRTSLPRIRLPQPQSLFADRAARLAQLAEGNPIGDYLRFLARLAKAQHAQAALVHTAPIDEDTIRRANEHGMPLVQAAGQFDPAWRGVLDGLMAAVQDTESLPEALVPVLGWLRGLDAEARDALARRVLTGRLGETEELAAAPLVMAALQVAFADQASRLREQDVPWADPATICPVCASPPTVSVVRIGAREAGLLRYLHCGTCGTEWHMVRVKCSHCESTRQVRYQSVQDGGDVVVAETCGDCHTYRKLVNQEKDPLAEPLADDLASLVLDLLMGETEFARVTLNPLLPMVEGAAP
jgi:FdhE protein